jgi:hypothetical protein
MQVVALQFFLASLEGEEQTVRDRAKVSDDSSPILTEEGEAWLFKKITDMKEEGRATTSASGTELKGDDDPSYLMELSFSGLWSARSEPTLVLSAATTTRQKCRCSPAGEQRSHQPKSPSRSLATDVYDSIINTLQQSDSLQAETGGHSVPQPSRQWTGGCELSISVPIVDNLTVIATM